MDRGLPITLHIYSATLVRPLGITVIQIITKIYPERLKDQKYNENGQNWPPEGVAKISHRIID